MIRKGLLARLEEGVVLGAEGYVFEMDLHPMLGAQVSDRDKAFLEHWKD